MIGAAHLRAGLRVLRRHLRYAGGNPRKLYWVARRAVSLAREGALPGVLERHLVEAREYANYDAWCLCYEPDAAFDFAPHIAQLPRRPLISILMPVWNPPVAFLAQALASVREQAYPHWELCIVDDASTDAAVCALLEREAANEPRIRLQRREHNGGIARASNDALAMASGEYCAFLDHDDRLARHALFALARAAVADPAVEMLFSDEDKLDADGHRTRPFFKPDWDGEWIRTT
ncbi:MAG TPA: glycosyltransferase, partial [Casimicrobiaceae bacterium]|nr:glycosyltransferase [Casimicrobiaceae bacterium]